MDANGPNTDTNYYKRIWKETEKEGLVWIKEDEKDCYAGHKNQNGKIIKGRQLKLKLF